MILSVVTLTVVRFRCPRVGFVARPLMTMIVLPWSSLPSVLYVGPGERITYGTGMTRASTNSTTKAMPATISVLTRRLRPRRRGGGPPGGPATAVAVAALMGTPPVPSPDGRSPDGGWARVTPGSLTSRRHATGRQWGGGSGGVSALREAVGGDLARRDAGRGRRRTARPGSRCAPSSHPLCSASEPGASAATSTPPRARSPPPARPATPPRSWGHATDAGLFALGATRRVRTSGCGTRSARRTSLLP